MASPATPVRIKNTTRAQPMTKKLIGSSVFFPEPQMDWDSLRRLKQKCENYLDGKPCPAWDELMGNCRIGFMPGCKEG